MAWNFALFWGCSVQAYEATLVSDQTPFDLGTMSDAAEDGMGTFFGAGHCAECHTGPEFTDASVRAAAGEDGFRNLGIRPIADDGGRGGDGSFKIPGLRNVELTGPYMHNGSASTLRQVVESYVRGVRNFDGDDADDELKDHIGKLEGDDEKIGELVEFLKALTDERVRHHRAPFDHPALPVPNGDDLPAVGAGGI